MANLNSRQRRKINNLSGNLTFSSWTKTTPYGDYRDYKFQNSYAEVAARTHKSIINHYRRCTRGYSKHFGSKHLSTMLKMIKDYMYAIMIHNKH